MTLIPQNPYRMSFSRCNNERKASIPLQPTNTNGGISADNTGVDLKAHRVTPFTTTFGRRHTLYGETEIREAKETLAKLFVPVAKLGMYRLRRSRLHKKNSELRSYTIDSIVQAYRSSNSIISTWPMDVLTLLAEGAQYHYLEDGEVIVYAREWYLSTGIIVVLFGELQETLPKSEKNFTPNKTSGNIRHPERSVLCEQTVLCRDFAPSRLKAHGYADVAVIPARWVWDAINYTSMEPFAEGMLDSLRMTVAPLCESVLERTYFPTALTLRRSWLWSFFSAGERIRLARLMEVKVFCAGDTLFGEGDRNPYVYIIRRGAVRVVVCKEPILDFGPGAAFGEVSVIFDEPRCCHAIATCLCEVYCLHRRHIMKRLRKKAHVCDSVIGTALRRREQWLEDAKTRHVMSLTVLLGGVPCLSQATEKVRAAIAEKAKTVVLPPRQVLFKKGTLCDHLFIVGRGTLLMEGAEDTVATRTSTGFVGELFLHPHLWPTDVTSLTSVDGWMFHVDVVKDALDSINAREQAVDICRQGIELYRAQYGPESVMEPTPAPRKLGPARKGTTAFSSGAKQSNSLRQKGQPRSPSLPSTPRLVAVAKTTPVKEEPLEKFDWNAYAIEDKVALPSADTDESDKRSERQQTEHVIEAELGGQAGSLLSAGVGLGISAIDCDFSDEVDEMRQMLLEQALLIPSNRLLFFLRQINRSKVTLVVDDGAVVTGECSLETTVGDDLTFPQYVLPPSVVYTLDNVNTYNVDGAPFNGEDVLNDTNRQLADGVGTTAHRRARTPEVALVTPDFMSTFRSTDEMANTTLKGQQFGGLSLFLRSGRPCSGLSGKHHLQHSSSLYGTLRRRSLSGVSRNYTPYPQTPFTPDVHGSTQYSFSNIYTRLNSVDYTQQAKITASALQSALDRFVKLDDQNYFQQVVRVCLPTEAEQQLITEEVGSGGKSSCDLILLLMHVRKCEGLQLSDDMQYPIVKVYTKTRVLIRTPIMEDRVEPDWPIEVASFITFIRRDADVSFCICDAGQEDKVEYTANLAAADLGENRGVGLRKLVMHRGATESNDEINETKATIEVCMMAVTTSKHHALQKHLDEEEDACKSSDDFSAIYLQVLGVKGLKHRIEAAVHISVEMDGKTKEVLRTHKIAPKTRSPAWPGQTSFCVAQGDGVISFDLFHRDTFVASYDTSVDTLAFGGTGVQCLPLLRAQGTGGDPYGDLYVSILGTKTPCGEEDVVERPSKLLVVHVEALSLRQNLDLEFVPDPFVIIRGPKGEVIMRTAMNFGTYEAKWSEERASCFILCPSLPGCVVTYHLEVYDNNESSKIGEATMTVTVNGTKRNRMMLDIGGKGLLTVVAHSFPIQDVISHSQPPGSGLTNHLTDTSSSSIEEGYFLQVHICSCESLQGTGFDDFQIDPVVTARVGRKRIVVAPLVSGCTAPQWKYPKATFVLPFVPDVLSHIVLEVWDTNIELCDVLGVARLPMEEICRTGTHKYTLQPHKDQEYGRRRDLGTIVVNTRFGRVNGAVVSKESPLFFSAGSSGSGIFRSRLFPSTNRGPNLPITRVRLHISSCCSAVSAWPFDFIKVTLTCLHHVLLEVRKSCKDEFFVAWSVDDAQTIVDLRAIYGRSLRLAVSGGKEETGRLTTHIGAAHLPFSTLASASPEVVSVRSLPLVDQATEERSSGSRSGRRCVTPSVSAQEPSITVSLLALDSDHSVSLGSE
ncbi:cAMP binding protein, putative [Trypanosoma equiperdum]|uniref:cAMP binding protein, putative n=1 Tax=Trypanosoma equiperdum TaxID=5694 RepID=A0A1G4I1C3_TRYEQ|nr:cAMP binding protein, putative [Trypanosoma equiperdum]